MTVWPHLLAAAEGMVARGLLTVERRSVNDLVARARARVGLTDLGDEVGEAALRRNLARVLDDVWDADIAAPMKRVIQDLECVDLIARRLEIIQARAADPDIARAPIHRPIWIVGSWRTGSTLLHQLMAQDPSARAIRRWEMLSPTPPPEPHTRRRIWRDTLSIRLLSPNLHRIHPYDPNQAEECFAMWITGSLPVATFHLPGMPRSLADYLDPGVQLRETYKDQRRVLQVLCHRKSIGSHLVLKCPKHTYKLETIAAVFEGSTFVWLHRNIAEVLPSLADLTTAIRQPFLPARREVDSHAVGRRAQELVRSMFEVGLAQRQRLEARGVQFVDVRHADLARDPVGTVAGLYEALGLEWGPRRAAMMQAFLDRQRRYERRRRDLGYYGLDDAQIASAFADYHERFGL